MTAKVFEFSARGAVPKHHRTTDKPVPQKQLAALTRLKTSKEVFGEVSLNVMEDWTHYAGANRLNMYIASRLTALTKGPADSDYANDLNAISLVEQRLQLAYEVVAPGFGSNTSEGWVASFQRGSETFTVPTYMASEAAARALNVVLYVSFDIQMKSLGR